jgi:hypothetical protein
MDDLLFLPWDQHTLDGALFAGRTLREFAPQSELRRAMAAVAARYAAGAPDPVGGRRRRR